MRLLRYQSNDGCSPKIIPESVYFKATAWFNCNLAILEGFHERTDNTSLGPLHTNERKKVL